MKRRKQEPSHVGHVAIHEAAHAIVAAYLKVPFRHVTLRRFTRTDGGHLLMEGLRGIRLYVSDRRGAYRQRSKKEVKAIVNRKYADRAVVILAARAAVEAGGFVSADGRPISTSKFKAGYRYDEERLKVIARTLRVAEFTAWRRQMLKRARDIVSIPHISRSILWVAVILEHELTMHEMKLGNGLVSAQKVREALRGGRELSAACSGGVVRRNSDQHRRPAP